MEVTMIMGKAQSLVEKGLSIFDLKSKNLSQPEVIALAIAAAIGVLFCFFGLKMVRLWAAFFGLTVGFAGGTYVADYFGANGTVSWIVGAVVGLVLAFLAARFYVAGVMIVGWILGIIISAIIMLPKDWMQILICVGIGLIVGLISAKFAEPATMVITAIFGGSTAGRAIFGLLPVDSGTIHTAITVALVIIGIILQFLMESKRKKKMHLKKAEEIRSQHSTANEVDQARAMFDEPESERQKIESGEDEDDDIVILNLDDDE